MNITNWLVFGSFAGFVLLAGYLACEAFRHFRAYYNRMGILFNRRSLWIGVHYSQYTRRYCVNLIPCCTLWFAKWGGHIPKR